MSRGGLTPSEVEITRVLSKILVLNLSLLPHLDRKIEKCQLAVSNEKKGKLKQASTDTITEVKTQERCGQFRNT